jgi:hypothetical protein
MVRIGTAFANGCQVASPAVVPHHAGLAPHDRPPSILRGDRIRCSELSAVPRSLPLIAGLAGIRQLMEARLHVAALGCTWIPSQRFLAQWMPKSFPSNGQQTPTGAVWQQSTRKLTACFAAGGSTDRFDLGPGQPLTYHVKPTSFTRVLSSSHTTVSVFWLAGLKLTHSLPERKMFRPLLPRHCSSFVRPSSLLRHLPSGQFTSVNSPPLQSTIRISARAFSVTSADMSKV